VGRLPANRRQIVPPIGSEENPPFTAEDFKRIYPFFFTVPDPEIVGDESKPLIPMEVVEMYIEFAHSSVRKWRWRDSWKVGISLFVAHFIELYMRVMVDPGCDAADVVNAGQTKGLVASKSVGGVSVSYNFEQALQGLEEWGEFLSTEYGAQFATLARLVSPRTIYLP